MIKVVKIVTSIVLTTVSSFAFGQSNPHPCTQLGVDCSASSINGPVYSFQNKNDYQYAPAGTSTPFWVAAGDKVTGAIDTSHSGPVQIAKISGPGNVQGTFTANFTKYHYFTDWVFSKPGTYEFEVTLVGYDKDTFSLTVAEEIDLCSLAPAGDCVNSNGNAVFTVRTNGGIIPVDAIFPITAGIYNKTTGLIDSSFYGHLQLEQLTGPGNMYGTFIMHGSNWFSFTDIRFDTPGTYTVGASTPNFAHEPDTFEVEVIKDNAVIEVDQKSLEMFPNPANTWVTIPLEGKSFVQIFNIVGEMVHNGQSSSKFYSVDLSEFKPGMYMVQVIHEEKLKTGVLLKK